MTDEYTKVGEISIKRVANQLIKEVNDFVSENDLSIAESLFAIEYLYRVNNLQIDWLDSQGLVNRDWLETLRKDAQEYAKEVTERVKKVVDSKEDAEDKGMYK